jgi:ATP-dependent helicase HepA
MTAFRPGQRYYSSAEPELGLGTVLRAEGRAVQIVFTKSGVVRQYAVHTAPLSRAEFRIGDRISGRNVSLAIERIDERDGMFWYVGDAQELCETDLDDDQAAGSADLKLINGRVDSNKHFQLRLDVLRARARARQSPAWGVLSARVSLLKHQLRVVEQALAQPHPRVLLADEVGLGKTIEAGLILARLLQSGRVARALIVVPEPLVFQWFIELMRRFNLRPAIFDEERAASIEAGSPQRNPFEDDQLVLTDIGFLSRNPKRSRQVQDAGWDLLIVDEAHHLAWTPEEASPEYALAETLALATPSVILLTATPEQLGLSGHFARLRLLDPDRYSDLAHFEREVEGFQALSRLSDALLADKPVSETTLEKLRAKLADEPALQAMLEQPVMARAQRDKLLDALIDRHGTGRVMFRNRRVAVGGFPRRVPQVDLLRASHDEALKARLLAEFLADVGAGTAAAPTTTAEFDAERENAAVLELSNDPRFAWLLDKLEEFSDEKLVLICRTARKVQLLEAALRVRSGVKVARFHEGLGLAQRDRNAAFFGDPEGARLLLCSEIGSEGRNFQFAHHLILWDLPLDPDLTEQRVGRLDRIGQTAEIGIHACALTGTAQSVLLRWYDEGIGALERSPPDGRELFRRFGDRLVSVAKAYAAGETGDQPVEQLLAESHKVHAELSARIHEGRDRLLEVAGERSRAGVELIHSLGKADEEVLDDELVVRLMEHYGVDTEELRSRTFRFDPEYISEPAFTGLGEEPRTVTFDRNFALSREDVDLLRFDHPLVQGSMELLLGGETGTSAFLVDSELPAQLVLLECVFVVECVAHRSLDAERYLAPQPIRLVVDTKLQIRDIAINERASRRGDEMAVSLGPLKKVLGQLVPPMLGAAQAKAEEQAKAMGEAANERAQAELKSEVDRLEALKRINPNVRGSEITALQQRAGGLLEALPRARVRLDALRLVVPPGFMKLR